MGTDVESPGYRCREFFLTSKKGLVGAWLEMDLYEDPYLSELMVEEE